MVAVKTNNYETIIAKPFAPNLGAEIFNVDLSKPIKDEQFEEIHHAFLQYQVLFFKNQKIIPPEIHVGFGKKFGELHSHPAAPTMETIVCRRDTYALWPQRVMPTESFGSSNF